MILKSLEIIKWNQFEKINIDFHSRLTIITGANGSGKSTILRLLGRIVGWNSNETATPLLSDDNYGFKSGISQDDILSSFEMKKQQDQPLGIRIGSLKTEKGDIDLYVPKETINPTYSIKFHSKIVQLKGVNIPSHRIPYSYKQVNSIPVKPRSKKEAFNLFNESTKKRTLPSGYYNSNDDPKTHLKETLMSLAVFGKGNEFVNRDNKSYELFVGFTNVLKLLMPETLGFQKIKIKNGEVILCTETGNFLIDAVSGGVGSIIDLAWQIYMYDENETESFIVLIDEAENHLHPSLQRTLLPNLLEAFPNVQFVVTTHSPFMVNSVQDSTVFVLNYNDEKKVKSERLDFINKTGNATEILREVLGVPVTLPLWIEKRINFITDKYSFESLTSETYLRLKSELAEIGLDDYLPDALGILGGGKN